MNKFIYQSSYKFNKDRYEKNSGKVLTVPDQSYSLREIVTRYARGQALPQIGHVPEYDEDYEDGDEVNPLRLPDADLSDITLMQSELEELAKKKESAERKKKQNDITGERKGAEDDAGERGDNAN